MTQYKKYLLVSVATAFLTPNMAQAAATAGAGVPTGREDSAVVRGPLPQLTMEALARFKPSKASTDATEVVVQAGYIYGSAQKAATLKPLQDLLGTWATETPSVVNTEASLENNVVIMHGLINPLLEHIAAIFTATAEINAPKAKPAGSSVKPSEIKAAGKGAGVASAPEVFKLVDHLTFTLGGKDAQQDVGGTKVATVKPLQDLFAGWAPLGLFNAEASAKDNMVALHDAVRALLENDAQGFTAYTTAVRKAASMSVTPVVLKSHELKPEDLAILRPGAEAGKSAAPIAGATVVSLSKALAASQEETATVSAKAVKQLEALKASHAAALAEAASRAAEAKAVLESRISAEMEAWKAAHAEALAALETKTAEHAHDVTAARAETVGLRMQVKAQDAAAAILTNEVDRLKGALTAVTTQQKENAAIRLASDEAVATALAGADKIADLKAAMDSMKALLDKSIASRDELSKRVEELLGANLKYQSTIDALRGASLAGATASARTS